MASPRVEITDLGKEGFTFKALVTVRPVITLKQYKGLTADKVRAHRHRRGRWTMSSSSIVDRATQLETGGPGR
ncbi:MAG: trigger factor [Flavonifractor plautii]